MTNVSWNERMQDELVWHLSAKQAFDKEQQTEMWALADGNSRGLKKSQKMYYRSDSEDYAVDKLREKLVYAIEQYRGDEFMINSNNEDYAEMVGEGYVQGLIRAYTISLGLYRHDESPPQDLSAFRSNLLTEVNNAKV